MYEPGLRFASGSPWPNVALAGIEFQVVTDDAERVAVEHVAREARAGEARASVAAPAEHRSGDGALPRAAVPKLDCVL